MKIEIQDMNTGIVSESTLGSIKRGTRFWVAVSVGGGWMDGQKVERAYVADCLRQGNVLRYDTGALYFGTLPRVRKAD